MYKLKKKFGIIRIAIDSQTIVSIGFQANAWNNDHLHAVFNLYPYISINIVYI